MKSLGGGNKAIDTIKSPHKRETFYEIRNIAHKKENKENIKERLFSQPHCKSKGYKFKQIFWTKRGIVRLGFFIKSERAKMFRDWAEDLVINKIDEAYQVQAQVQQLSLFPEPVKRNHNRLTKERMIDILADVAKIEDKNIRLSLIDKLTNIKA